VAQALERQPHREAYSLSDVFEADAAARAAVASLAV
jgi:hypothetical protein